RQRGRRTQRRRARGRPGRHLARRRNRRRRASVIVRLATQDDAPKIFDLLKLMHAEVGLAPMAPDKVVRRMVAAIDGGFVLVAERDGDIVGSIGLVVDSWWYSDRQLLRDLWT